ncbi:hypothetical protein BGX30_008466, partial [Mortierella sp. GBA39]
NTMRFTLVGLLALVGSVAASHNMCAYKKYGDFTDDYHVTLTHSNEVNPIMDQSGEHFVSTKTQTFKNRRGRVDLDTGGGWSAAFDGQDWGGYWWMSKYDWGKKSVAWGCYNDKAAPGWCNLDMFEACKRKHGAS